MKINFTMAPWKALIVLAASCQMLSAQPVAPRAEFEVTSIKPDDGANPRQGVGINASGTFTAQNVTLRKLIMEAYDLRDVQVVGGPAWVDSDRFDIIAKTNTQPGGYRDAPASMEARWAATELMLRSLLEDRFHLVVHHETRELAVYVLAIAKGGFRPRPPDCVELDPKNPPQPAPGQHLQYCGNISYGRNGLNRTLDGGQITMIQFIQYGLGNSTDRIILDKTGLTGKYTFHLEWAPSDVTSGNQTDGPTALSDLSEASGPSIFTAIEEQLGLRLESTKAPVQVLAIDHVSKPSAD